MARLRLDPPPEGHHVVRLPDAGDLLKGYKTATSATKQTIPDNKRGTGRGTVRPVSHRERPFGFEADSSTPCKVVSTIAAFPTRGKAVDSPTRELGASSLVRRQSPRPHLLGRSHRAKTKRADKMDKICIGTGTSSPRGDVARQDSVLSDDNTSSECETTSVYETCSSVSSHTRTSSGSESDPGSPQPRHILKIFHSRVGDSPFAGVSKSRPVTPPTGLDSRSKLISPSKKIARIPTPPGRPSIDVFWDPEKINSWNDKHSPLKTLESPKKPFTSLSLGMSPMKSSSPDKSSRAQVTARKAFEAQKERLAKDFLKQLDDTITDGQMAALTAWDGGIKIIWSKTLNKTAGRAHKRDVAIRETTTTTTAENTIIQTTTKPSARIELASKVLDSNHKLHNTLAHEFCHLANFLISNVRDQPHGASFKRWANRVQACFGVSHGVKVTTRHSYDISYKYVWRCTTPLCGAEYKRHSKSVDPVRQRCSACVAGVLEQIKPAPRRGGVANEYTAFVKENYAVVKSGLPSASPQKVVMQVLGQRYRDAKKRADELDVETLAEGVGESESVDGLCEMLTLLDA